jgi:ketosteroid isomerase-like protein
MGLAENKALVCGHFEEVWNKRNIDVLTGYVSPDAVDYGDVNTIGRKPGHDGFREHYYGVQSRIANFHIEPEDVVAEGDTVVVFWVASGTMADATTPFRARAVSRLRVVEGKIVEYRVLPDWRAVQQQGADGRTADARRVSWCTGGTSTTARPGDDMTGDSSDPAETDPDTR